MKHLLIIITISISLSGLGLVQAQSVSLKELHTTLENEFPTINKKDIQRRITALSLELKSTGWHPEILVSAKASYQSDVTEVDFAGPAAPQFSKDHYSFSIDINQTLYEGGRIGHSKQLTELQGEVALANLNVELWQIKAQLEELYFGILLINNQLAVIDTIIEDVSRQLELLTVKVEEGLLLPGMVWSLEASQIKNQQSRNELFAQKKALISGISILTGTGLSETTNFEIPTTMAEQNWDASFRNRPELELLASKEQLLNQKMQLTKSNGLPVVSMFARTAYSRPGLNAFDDNLQLYWLAGIKATWRFKDWRNSSRERALIQFEAESVEEEKEMLSRSITSTLKSIEERIKSLRQTILLDEKMLELRTQIVDEKEAQLQEGVITSTEYVTVLSAKHLAMINLELHKTQLMKAEYEYLNNRGLSW